MIPVEKPHLYVTAITHPGMKGKNNEDRYLVAAHHLGPNNSTPSLLLMISDGVGGHRAGEVAANIAVETVEKIVAQSDGLQPKQTLRLAIRSASDAIFTQSEKNSARRGMGATCVCAWIIGDLLYAAWVGDSRLYRLRGDTIVQLTTDHTWVQEAIEFGALTPEQAKHHPNAHVIRRYLGSPEPPDPDFRLCLPLDGVLRPSEDNQGQRLLPGDRLVLCSDGLTDLVKPEEIQAELKPQTKLPDALHRLVNLANSRGGHDNITIIAAEVPPSRYPTVHRKRLPKRASRLTVVLLIALLSLSILLGVSISSLMVIQGWRAATPSPTAALVDTKTSPKEVIALPSLTATKTSTITVTPSPSITPTPSPTTTPLPTDTATITLTLSPTNRPPSTKRPAP